MMLLAFLSLMGSKNNVFSFSFVESQWELLLASIWCSLCGANGCERDSLSVWFLCQDKKPIFFSYLKSLWPSRKKDDIEIMRSWKDVLVLTTNKTIRVAACLPIWREIEKSRGMAIASAFLTVWSSTRRLSHILLLCITLSNYSDVQWEADTYAKV